MKKTIAIILFMFLLIPFVLAQGGGGMAIKITSEEFYEMSDNFTKCLIDNCDYFCKNVRFDYGAYDKDNKCYCVSYLSTEKGKIVYENDYIEVNDCSYEVSKKGKFNKILKIFIASIFILGTLLIFLGLVFELCILQLIWRKK